MTEHDPFEPGRWYKVVGPQGELWNETSDPDEALESLRPGDTLYRLYVRHEEEWRTITDPEGTTHD